MLDELSGMLRSFLDRKKWSARQMAAYVGVSDTTISRIIGREQIPRIRTVKSILNVICGDEEFRQFMARHYPAAAGYLTERKSRFVNDPDAVKFFTKNSHTFHLLMLLPLKLRKQAIRYNLGALGGMYLEESLNRAFTREVNRCINGSQYSINTEEDLIRTNELGLEHLKEHGYDYKDNSFSFDTFLGNEKAASRLKEAYANLIREIDDIRNSPDCEGKRVFLAGSFMAKMKNDES